MFAPTCLENEYVLAQLGDLNGKRVLDIGCGQGDTSVLFSLRGAEVRQGQYHPRQLRRLQNIDEWVFRHCPSLGKYTWLTIITASKQAA